MVLGNRSERNSVERRTRPTSGWLLGVAGLLLFGASLGVSDGSLTVLMLLAQGAHLVLLGPDGNRIDVSSPTSSNHAALLIPSMWFSGLLGLLLLFASIVCCVASLRSRSLGPSALAGMVLLLVAFQTVYSVVHRFDPLQVRNETSATRPGAPSR